MMNQPRSLERCALIATCMRPALAEADPEGFPHRITVPTAEGRQLGALYVSDPDIDRVMRRKASRLAILTHEGPEVLVGCDYHNIPGRYDLWSQCPGVRVYDALMGRLCEVAP